MATETLLTASITGAARRRARHTPAPLAAALLVVFGSAYLWAASAQAPASHSATKKALTIDDYTKWRSINSPEISGDGKWVTYGCSSTNMPTADTKPVLHLLNLETNQDVEVANATRRGVFGWTRSGSRTRSIRAAAAADAAVGAGAGGARHRLRPRLVPQHRRRATGSTDPQAAPAPHRPAGQDGASAGRGGTTPPTAASRVELRNLATGAMQSWQDIQSFTFSANVDAPDAASASADAGRRRGAAREAASAVAARRRRRRRRAAATRRRAGRPRGVDVIVHNLMTGAISCSAASATSRSTRPAICSPTPSTRR